MSISFIKTKNYKDINCIELCDNFLDFHSNNNIENKNEIVKLDYPVDIELSYLFKSNTHEDCNLIIVDELNKIIVGFCVIDFSFFLLDSDERDMIGIDDLIFNPDIDFAYYIELILKFYQEMGWKTIYINTHLMQHHQLIVDIFQFHNSIYIEPTNTIYRKINERGLEKDEIEYENIYFEKIQELKEKELKKEISENEYNIIMQDFINNNNIKSDNHIYDKKIINGYFIQLYKNSYFDEIKKSFYNILIEFDNIKHSTKGKLINYISMEECGYESIYNSITKKIERKNFEISKNLKFNKTILLFDDPLFINNEKINLNLDFYFDIYINDELYPNKLRFNKIILKKIKSAFGENNYNLIYGIEIYRDITKNEIMKNNIHNCYYQDIKKKNYYFLHNEEYYFSLWLKKFPKIINKNQDYPILFKKNIIEKFINIYESDSENESENNNSIVESNNKVSYIYLIQERENYNLKNNVYKFGRCTQVPNNVINRLKSGYKKGSKILFIMNCDNDKVVSIETNIRKKFTEIFEKHEDGHEHFIGDSNEMIKTIFTIIQENN